MTRLRDQIAAPARTILLVLLGAAAVVFVIACSNVANLILARSVRREGELAVRAALGAGHGALRRTLLAESLVLCGAGAVLGVLLARPFVALVGALRGALLDPRARSHGRRQRAVGWRGARHGRSRPARLRAAPAVGACSAGLGLAAGGVRITPGTNRRLRIFATTQIALSFVLLAGAGMLLTTLVALQTANTGYDMRHVVAFDIPTPATGVGGAKVDRFLSGSDAADRRTARRGGRAVGSSCRGATPAVSVRGFRFTVEGYTRADGEESRARGSGSRPALFAVARHADDRRPRLHRRGPRRQRAGRRSSARASRSGCFRTARRSTGTCGAPIRVLRQAAPRRIVGVVADVDDESVVPAAGDDDLSAGSQIGLAGRLFVHAAGDPYAVVPAVTRVIRDMSRRTSRSSAPRRSRTCARRCCRPSG